MNEKLPIFWLGAQKSPVPGDLGGKNKASP
jgi:hypothetical protein